jgi:hypothetical protein
MFTGYLIAGVSGFTVLTNAFLALHLDNWSEIPFPDMNGNMHRIHLPTGGLLFMTILKILTALIGIKWGMEAIRTFKPIAKEIEREQIHGVSQEGHNGNVAAINTHRGKVVKYMLWSFALLSLSLLYTRRYFTDVAFRFIDDEYDAYEARNQTQGYNNSYEPWTPY